MQVHVTYVLQTTLLMIKADQALPRPCLTDLDRLALLIAAYCHDVDHDGALCKPSQLWLAALTRLVRSSDYRQLRQQTV